MAPRKKTTTKKEEQTVIPEVAEIDNEVAAEPVNEVTEQMLNQAHEMNEAYDVEQMCFASDRSYKRYEIVRAMLANDSTITRQTAKSRIQDMIVISDVALDLLEKRDEAG